jgi:zinc transport system substrate-binding protein
MKRTIILFILAVIAVFLIVSFSLYFKKDDIQNDGIMRVGATITPVADIVEAIGGEKVKVVLIVPEGQSPHTFDPSPGTIRDLSEAKIVFKIGLIDDWISEIIVSSDTEEFFIGEGVNLMQSKEILVFGDDHDDEEYDPHYWLSVANGRKMAENIFLKLSETDPDNVGYYSENFNMFLSAADTAEEEIREALSDIKINKMITFHDAWGYFAEEYGLEIVAVYQPSPGKEPSPGDVKGIVDTAKNFGIKVFFSEKQYSPSSLIAIGEGEGITVVPLDPLLGNGYLRSLIENARKIGEALSV